MAEKEGEVSPPADLFADFIKVYQSRHCMVICEHRLCGIAIITSCQPSIFDAGI